MSATRRRPKPSARREGPEFPGSLLGPMQTRARYATEAAPVPWFIRHCVLGAVRVRICAGKEARIRHKKPMETTCQAKTARLKKGVASTPAAL